MIPEHSEKSFGYHNKESEKEKQVGSTFQGNFYRRWITTVGKVRAALLVPR